MRVKDILTLSISVLILSWTLCAESLHNGSAIGKVDGTVTTDGQQAAEDKREEQSKVRQDAQHENKKNDIQRPKEMHNERNRETEAKEKESVEKTLSEKTNFTTQVPMTSLKVQTEMDKKGKVPFHNEEDDDDDDEGQPFSFEGTSIADWSKEVESVNNSDIKNAERLATVSLRSRQPLEPIPEVPNEVTTPTMPPTTKRPIQKVVTPRPVIVHNITLKGRRRSRDASKGSGILSKLKSFYRKVKNFFG
ncbi:hypothetical protein M514_09902 [Trichuris suis]|uniref:Uncharacterized protein n=1 Tax=Trichuris suis TaxID=68888 RepID=A0A085N818_9BILA|nr:hypothetical protein M514_09902 [Trichuris suis]